VAVEAADGGVVGDRDLIEDAVKLLLGAAPVGWTRLHGEFEPPAVAAVSAVTPDGMQSVTVPDGVAIAEAIETAMARAEIVIVTGGLGPTTDDITREAVASLFDGGIDPMVVIRWKDLFERLEEAIDACERAANIIESVIIKHA